jgi:hypothetical protein
MKLPEKFATADEMELRFLSHLPKGWTAYRKVGEWDLLLVRKEDGAQLGLISMMRLSAIGLTHAVAPNRISARTVPQPDYRGVLTPSGQPRELAILSRQLGVTCIFVTPPARATINMPFTPPLPPPAISWEHREEDWQLHAPLMLLQLPDGQAPGAAHSLLQEASLRAAVLIEEGHALDRWGII